MGERQVKSKKAKVPNLFDKLVWDFDFAG